MHPRVTGSGAHSRHGPARSVALTVEFVVYDDDRMWRRTGRIGRRRNARGVDRETWERIREIFEDDPELTAYEIAVQMVDEGFEIDEETVEFVLQELTEEA